MKNEKIELARWQAPPGVFQELPPEVVVTVSEGLRWPMCDVRVWTAYPRGRKRYPTKNALRAHPMYLRDLAELLAKAADAWDATGALPEQSRSTHGG